jgi:hypothetical protein
MIGDILLLAALIWLLVTFIEFYERIRSEQRERKRRESQPPGRDELRRQAERDRWEANRARRTARHIGK